MKKLPRGYKFIENKQVYECRFTFEGTRYSVYGNSVKECENKKLDRIKDLEEHKNLENERITLAKYYNQIWLVEVKKAVKKSTVYSYEKQWKNIEPYLGGKQIKKIQKHDVINYQQLLKQDGKTETTVNNAVKLLKQILESAVCDRIITFNPCKNVRALKVEKPKATETNHRALTQEEVILFMQYAKDSHYYNLFVFLLLSGCRVGEATALSVFDIKENNINIHKTVSRTSNKGFELVETPKSSTSNRLIPITEEMADLIKNQKARNKMFSFRENWLFPNTRGEMANYNNINNCIHSIINVINVKEGIIFPQFSVHALRDTFSTICAEQGMQVNTLKTLMGHSSYKMTMDIYSHVRNNTKLSELEKIKFYDGSSLAVI